MVQENITLRFQGALQDFLERVQKDQTVLAVVLFGSLSYDTVWERSDIDLMLVTVEERSSKDRKTAKEHLCLIERDVHFHAHVFTRSAFKQIMEGKRLRHTRQFFTLAGKTLHEIGEKRMDWRERISIQREVCHGKPCFQGTRVLVSVILDYLAEGDSQDEILRQYPSLAREDLQAAISYAAWLAHEEEQHHLHTGIGV